MASKNALLKIAIKTGNQELLEQYSNYISKHNTEVQKNKFPNAGFDLFIPKQYILDTGYKSQMVDLDVKCEMSYEGQNTGFFLFPRSSISKTPLVLANHTGIIDSGYRGSLMAAVRNLDQTRYTIDANTRLFQICHPSLCPVVVEIVDESELSSTERNDGGFGSTGK